MAMTEKGMAPSAKVDLLSLRTWAPIRQASTLLTPARDKLLGAGAPIILRGMLLSFPPPTDPLACVFMRLSFLLDACYTAGPCWIWHMRRRRRDPDALAIHSLAS